MLNMVMKTGEQLQIGDDILIKIKSDGRSEIAIDAPREVAIKRLAVDDKETLTTKAPAKAGAGKKIIVVNKA